MAATTAWAGGDHESIAEDRRVVLNLLLLLLPELAGLVVGLQGSQLLGLLAEEIDHVWHGEVVQAIAPGQLQDDIGANKIIACVEHANIAFAVSNIDELGIKLATDY